MSTNEQLRKQALRLVTVGGVSQKVLAGKMGMTPSTFSKWLHKKQGIGPASVDALDGLQAYIQELRALIDSHESRMESRRTAPPVTAGERFSHDRGHPEPGHRS